MALKLKINVAIKDISVAHVFRQEGATPPASFILKDINPSTSIDSLNEIILEKLIQEEHRIKYRLEYHRAAQLGSLDCTDIDQAIEKWGIVESDSLHVRLISRMKQSPQKRAPPPTTGESIAKRRGVRAAAKEATKLIPEALKWQEDLEQEEKKIQKQRREKNQSKKTTSTKTSFKKAGKGYALGSNGDDATSETEGDEHNSEDGDPKNMRELLLAKMESRRNIGGGSKELLDSGVEILLESFRMNTTTNQNKLAQRIRNGFQSALDIRSFKNEMQQAVFAVEQNKFSFHEVDRDEFHATVGHRLGTGEEDDDELNPDNYRVAKYEMNFIDKIEEGSMMFKLIDDPGALIHWFETYYEYKDMPYPSGEEIERMDHGCLHYNFFGDILEPEALVYEIPHVYWSLVYHFNRNQEREMTYKDMLMELMPECDWSFLGKEGRKVKARVIRKCQMQKDSILQK